jgi:6-phosphogluconolactonase
MVSSYLQLMQAAIVLVIPLLCKWGTSSRGCEAIRRFSANRLDGFSNLLNISNVENAANNFASNITRFRIEINGHLKHIQGSILSIGPFNARPSQVLFKRDGRIVVNELSTNHLSVFNANKDGNVTGPIINDSNDIGPFGSLFLSSGILLVTEAGSNALSSYSLSDTGLFNVISGSVPNGQKATCWVTPTRDERR